MFGLNEEKNQIIRRRTTMKKLSHSFKLLMMTMLFVGMTLVVAGTASAEWYVIHGVTGQIENESVLERISRTGKGLEGRFESGDNKETWVHFAVPSLKGPGTTRYIRVICSKNGTEVIGLEVRNGGSLKIEMKEDKIPDAWKGDGWRNMTLDLTDAPIDSQNGIGISVKVRSKDIHPRLFRFISAQANFDENKTY
jgi:hypothetical protein